MGSGFSKMKKQRRLLEEQFGAMKEKLQTTEVEGQSGNGLVTVTLNGEREIKSIKIKPECVDPNDVEGLEDLICAAFAEAYKKLDDNSALGGMGGMGFPF